VIAGNPPAAAETGFLETRFYARAIESLGDKAGVVSVDLEGEPLKRCILTGPQPAVIKINRDEFDSVGADVWRRFNGTLVVTDSRGCDLFAEGAGGSPVRLEAARVGRVYSTIGAGDAFHAGFTIARSVWEWDVVRSARYGLAAAAAAVSAPDGTGSITRGIADRFFEELSSG
jgi:fructose-1-phosphate kinase PfkB-like protein